MTFPIKKLNFVYEHARNAACLQSIADTLEWDERTGLPSGGGEYRARQVSMIRGETHRMRTDPKFGAVLTELADQIDPAADPHWDDLAAVRELHHDWDRNRKLPVELVQQLSLASVHGQQAWEAARKGDRFADFLQPLSNVIDLTRQQAARLQEGTSRTLYETLLDEYEPGASEATISEVFGAIRQPLVDLIEAVVQSPRQPNLDCLTSGYAKDLQRKFSQHVCQAIGFDFDRGRLDETSHPFCTTLGPSDIRILTRYEEKWLPGGLFGSLHEAGHGTYEQGLRTEWFGLPPGSHASLGVHESQSRLWENQVGRSREFWQWCLPEADRLLGGAMQDRTVDEVFFAVNAIQPSLIRVEADEATYNLHIIIRYELERQLIDGTLAPADLPEAWNDSYQRDLGIRPPSDADGVLQDVHWSAGLFGYFPTYTLGNVIAAQLFASAGEQQPELTQQIANGDFAGLLGWLGKHVHQPGRCYRSEDLVQHVTGQPLTAKFLIDYLRDKLTELYEI